MAGDVRYLFDAEYYLAQNPDVREAGVDAYTHYLNQGWKEGRDPNAYFDTDYYLMVNGDVAKAGINPLLHYVYTGAAEGRAASVLFDSEYYLSQNADVRAHGINPLLHFLWQGEGEMRDPNAFFDVSHYMAHRPDLVNAGVKPLAHFLTQGWREHTDPGKLFNTAYYLQQNPDVEKAGINPLIHWLTNGVVELRNPNAKVDLKTLIETDQPFQQAVDIPNAKQALSRVLNHADRELGVIPVRSAGPGNRAPLLENADDVTFAENTVNAGAQIIDADVTFTDDNSNFDTGFLHLEYTGGGGAEDTLSIANVGSGAGQIGFDGTNVSYEGTVIGTVFGSKDGSNGNELLIIFNSDAGKEAVEALVENLTYANGSDAPAGTRTLKITVNDGSLDSDAVPVVITVTPENDAPTLDNALVDQAGTRGVAFNYQFAADSFGDPDTGDTLTYSITSGMPGWMSFDDTTRTFSGTAGVGQHGVFDIVVRATDGAGAYVEDTVRVTIVNPNSAPTHDTTILSQIADTGTLYSKDVSGSFSDPDGDSLTYSATLQGGGALPAWLSINPATGVLSGTSAGGDIGTITVVVNAADAEFNVDSNAFTLTVGDYDVLGTEGADNLVVSGGNNEQVHAGAGNDTISAGYEDDVWGGDGADTITVIRGYGYGEAGDDVLIGGGNAEWLVGGAGADTLTGGSGNYADSFVYNDPSESTAAAQDVITDFRTSKGDQIIIEAADFPGIIDLVNGAPDADSIGYSYDGTDTIITATNGWQVKLENAQSVAIRLENGSDDTVLGSHDNDSLWGPGSGTIYGGEGNDTIFAMSGDIAYGEEGNDTLSAANSTLIGGDGDDILSVRGGRGSLQGDDGDDSLTGYDNSDTLEGGGGADTITGGTGRDIYVYTAASESTVAEQDVITDFNSAEGDEINVSGGDFDSIDGFVNGAATADKIGYSFSGGDLTLTATNGWNILLENMTDLPVVFIDVDGSEYDFVISGDAADSVQAGNYDTVYTGAGNDTISGSVQHTTVYGGDGDDYLSGGYQAVLYGEGGNDRFWVAPYGMTYGGDGNDTFEANNWQGTVTGGTGNDIFKFSSLAHSTDTAQDLITDWTDGDDTIDLSGIGGLGFGDFTISLVGGNTLIDHNASTFSILLTGDHTGTLDAGDFIF